MEWNLQVVSQHSWLLAPMAVNAVKRIIDPARDTSVNLKMIKIIKKMGDTVEVFHIILSTFILFALFRIASNLGIRND